MSFRRAVKKVPIGQSGQNVKPNHVEEIGNGDHKNLTFLVQKSIIYYILTSDMVSPLFYAIHLLGGKLFGSFKHRIGICLSGFNSVSRLTD